MIRNLCTHAIGLICILVLAATGRAQETKQFYKKPETTAELWHYMNHEIEVGNFKLAAEYLKGFVAKNPKDEELLQIQEREGNSAFVRLLAIPELQADAKPLIARVNEVLQKHLSDPKWLGRLIKNLSATPEERAYSVQQLRRAGSLAVPALMSALLDSENNPVEHGAILSALAQLDQKAMPPLYAALDVGDVNIRNELIETFRNKLDTGAVPHLWYYSAAPSQPELIRKNAAETLAVLRGVKPGQLPPAKVALTQQAEKYYHHQESFGDPAGVKVWRWEGKRLLSQTLTPTQAEEHFGLRAARRALELDPGYKPAQIAFLSIALEKGFEKAGGLDQSLAKGAPEVKELLTSVNPELLIDVLNRALDDHRLAVILAATRGLGDLAEVRAARQTTEGGTPVLVRALSYPDRRVQLAAADSLLRIPTFPVATAAARVVDVLRRAAGGETSRVLIADTNQDRANAVAGAVSRAGFQPVVVRTGREVLRRVSQAADIDILLIDSGTPDPQLPYLLAQLRADVNAGSIPLLVTASPDALNRWRRLAEHYRNVWVIPATTDSEVLKQVFAERLADSMGKPLSETERRDNALLAIEWFARMARGELRGYDLRPAEDAILQAIQNKELAGRAIEAASGLPGRRAQSALATAVLDPNQPISLRSEAAVELTRHIQQNGLLLASNEIKGLQDNFAASPDPKLNAKLALVIGSMHPDARQTGERLQRFTPVFATPAPAKDAPRQEPAEKKDTETPGESGSGS